MARMMHPDHGWHVVSAGDDVAAMRRAGWVDDDGKAIAAKRAALGLAQPQAPTSVVAPEPAAPVKRGPGRPRKA